MRYHLGAIYVLSKKVFKQLNPEQTFFTKNTLSYFYNCDSHVPATCDFNPWLFQNIFKTSSIEG